MEANASLLSNKYFFETRHPQFSKLEIITNTYITDSTVLAGYIQSRDSWERKSLDNAIRKFSLA